MGIRGRYVSLFCTCDENDGVRLARFAYQKGERLAMPARMAVLNGLSSYHKICPKAASFWFLPYAESPKNRLLTYFLYPFNQPGQEFFSLGERDIRDRHPVVVRRHLPVQVDNQNWRVSLSITGCMRGGFMFTSAAARDEDLEKSNWGREAVSECFYGLSFFHTRLVIIAGGVWTYMAGRMEAAGGRITVVVVRFISRAAMRKDDTKFLHPFPPSNMEGKDTTYILARR